MWTSFLCLTVYFLITTHKVGASSISGQEIGAQRESVDTGKIYNFFTNDVVAQKFFVTIILQVNVYYKLLLMVHNFLFPQFLFTCIGWVVSNRLWTLARGGAVENDPNVSGLSDFVLSDQIAGSNVALGIGYV